jgi:CRP/FNR family cyclic AMP-dependent transcriptional regulator
VRDEDGRETVVARLTEGDSFGEVGLLQQRRRSATVRALEPTDLIALGRADFDLLAGTWKHLARSLEELARSRTIAR